MFDYEDITDEQIDKLTESTVGSRAAAGLLVIKGMHNGIVSPEEGVKQLNNLLVSILLTEADEEET